MSFHLDPQMRHAGTSAGNVTLTSSEIVAALIPARLGLAAVGLLVLPMML